MPSWDWLGDDLAVDLANTVRRRRDGDQELLATPGDLRDWLAHEAGRLPAAGPVGEPELRRFVALRDEALAVLRAAAQGRPAPAWAVAAIDARVLRTPTVRLLGDPAPRVLRAPDPLSAVLGVLAAAVVDLAGRAAGAGLALCDAPGCGQLFLRRRADQRWCGPGCGNRVRAARHHARHARPAER